MEQRATEILNTVHVSGTTWLKRMKRRLLPKGKMMQIYEQIERAVRLGNVDSIRLILSELKTGLPEFWTPHYTKYVELILLCQYLVISPENDEAKSAALFRLKRVLDPSHEIGRRIQGLIGLPVCA